RIGGARRVFRPVAPHPRLLDVRRRDAAAVLPAPARPREGEPRRGGRGVKFLQYRRGRARHSPSMALRTLTLCLALGGCMKSSPAVVRYIVTDVDRSVEFYTQTLGFQLKQRTGPFAAVSLGNPEPILRGPGTSGAAPMPRGPRPGPAGGRRPVGGMGSSSTSMTWPRAWRRWVAPAPTSATRSRPARAASRYRSKIPTATPTRSTRAVGAGPDATNDEGCATSSSAL